MLFIHFSAFATHQRAGEITYRHISGLTYEVIVVTYTYSTSPADRCELEVFWGDGTSDIIPRINGPSGFTPGGIPCNHLGEIVDTLIRKNIYSAQHTFSSAGDYIMSVEDPNRNYGVINIPNSVNIPLYIETRLLINPFVGTNNSPQLLLPPIDKGCVGHPFFHNPGAYDPDGDSLSYELVACKGASGMDIPGFTLPQASNSFTINPTTGEIIWDVPIMQGEYNIAFLVKEWRNGILIGYVTRDMQITITSCENEAPQILEIADTCIMAGETLQFEVTATDTIIDKITLTGNGGPLLTPEDPATFPESVEGYGIVSGTFIWNTSCVHVRKSPWQMYFKATDNSTPVNLSDVMSMNISVIGPPPQPFNSIALGNSITIEWLPYGCENASTIFIYRRNDSYPYEYGACDTGIPPESGYVKIAEVPADGVPSFTDNNNGLGLIHGINYCYRLSALYPDGAESYISEEICGTLKKDLPILTNVSVENTALTDGAINLVWSMPTELDFELTPGPFIYHIYRKNYTDNENPILIDSIFTLTDTIYLDNNINTKEKQWSYFIDFINNTPNNRFSVGQTQIANSVFLKTNPTDRAIKLSWLISVPWKNTRYDVFKENSTTGFWDSITSVTQAQYTDTSLTNGDNYCYYIRSIGTYSAPGLVNPIVNLSQIACDYPIDNVPPCPPELSISTNCEYYENNLFWTNPMHTCGTELTKYYIYAAPDAISELTVIDSTLHPSDTLYIHSFEGSITGCYYVTAIDANGNTSEPSNLVCIPHDTCSIYRLPNVFTPNNDGYNDLLIPFPYTAIEYVDADILNRWGQTVYHTNDPDINWDGINESTKKLCPDGVYFYVIKVNEITLSGIIKRTVSGQVHLLRGE